MRIQEDDYSCGPASIVNVVKCFDKNVSMSLVSQLSGVDKDGTDALGIVRAFSHIGYMCLGWSFSKSGEAFDSLIESLDVGRPCIISVDHDTHWMVTIGRLGERIVVFDSDNTMKNKREHGVHVLDKKRLSKRWKNRKGEFYFIEVIEK